MGIIVSDHKKRWPGGCVIWKFHDATSSEEEAAFRAAMTSWTNNARNVRFLERTTQKSYVLLTPDGDIDGVNHSDIGMNGGEQKLLLEPILLNDNRERAARHEFGHTLGFHHEQVRCDRDNSVRIDMSKIPLSRYFDYDKQCGNEWKIVGDYDFRSVMHYRPKDTVTTDGSMDITAVDPDNAAILAQNKIITAGDGAALAELHGGRAHVYQLSSDGQIEKTVQQYGWNSGWSTVTPFLMGVDNFLFLLKESDGRALVLPINFDGTIRDEIDDNNWSSGWTSATKYAILLDNYLLLYKRGDGTRHLNRINSNGTIGAQAVASAQIEPGWTSIRQYTIGLNNFLIFVNSATGRMRVRRIDFDGTEGEPIQTVDWDPGWTSVEPYVAGGTNRLLLLNSGSGAVSTRVIRDDGKISSSGVHRYDLAGGWSTAVPYEVSGNTYLLLCNKDTGDLRIRELSADGRLGSYTDRRSFGPGWDIAKTYHVGLGTYAIFVKT